MYKQLDCKLPGNVAIKVHSGEFGNKNFLRPEFWRPVVEEVGGTIVECNTAYGGSRATTKTHCVTLEKHGWSHYFDVDLLDGEGPDLELPSRTARPSGKTTSARTSQSTIPCWFCPTLKGSRHGRLRRRVKSNFPSALHPHTAKATSTAQVTRKMWSTDQDLFLSSMADAASSVINFFKGQLAYVNVMKNISVDCDCDNNAAPP